MGHYHNEKLICGRTNLKEVDEATCVKVVQEGFLMNPRHVPELYYNETFRLQLEHACNENGFTVLSRKSEFKPLPYNHYWNSLRDQPCDVVHY